MSDEIKLSKLERLKESSQQLRGSIAEELTNESNKFTADAGQLLKHHGVYQQDDRDQRNLKNEDGSRRGKAYSCMVRTRIPGGRVTAEQFLAELDLADQLADGTVRVTTRQGFQLHGVLKGDLHQVIRAINTTKLTTFAACGDVNRNVMCCPFPDRQNPVREAMQTMAYRLAEHLRPRTSAYYDLWIRDEEGNKLDLPESGVPFPSVEEPIYGARYLPRKFKCAIALPEDNCVDVYTQDLGLLAIVRENRIIGYNVLVGGGMGRTPSAEKTFPALGKRLAFVEPEEVLFVAEAIVKVQRDYGNRADRKIARMKYLIADWGIDHFRSVVEEYYGRQLADPAPDDVTGIQDHLGWNEQGDGRLCLGINIDSGRIKDDGDLRLKTALRRLLTGYGMETRLTPLQSLILCDIDPARQAEISNLLADHGVQSAEELSPVRRHAMACPAFPMCGLALTESERVLPQVIGRLETQLARLALTDTTIAVHMTGCPNGCARPYTPDIGLVGRASGKYSIFLGGNPQGTRLAFLYRDMVPFDDLIPSITPVLEDYKAQRAPSESFGDYCHRLGNEALPKLGESSAA